MTGEPAGLSHAKALQRLLRDGHGIECLTIITEYASEGRVAKMDQSLFSLAMCTRFGDATVRTQVYQALPKICGIPTMLFAFLEFSKALHAEPACGSGWGRMQRRGVVAWYNGQDALRLAQGITKYRNRKGWKHLDVLRLCHPTPKSQAHAACFRHCKPAKVPVEAAMAQLTVGVAVLPGKRKISHKVTPTAMNDGEAVTAEAIAAASADARKLAAVESYLAATDAALACRDEAVLVALIQAHRLVREHCPTELLGSALVWRALLQDMPIMAMLRNLNKMTAVGLFADVAMIQLVVVMRLPCSVPASTHLTYCSPCVRTQRDTATREIWNGAQCPS